MRRVSGIRRRLFQWLLLPLVALFAIGLYSDFRLAYGPAVDAYDQALADTALALSACLRQENGRIIMALNAQADAVLRVDHQDRIYFAVYREGGGWVAGDEMLPYVADASDDLDFRDVQLDDQSIRVATMRFALDGQQVRIEAAETTRKRTQVLHRILATIAGTDLLQILAVLAIVALGVRAGLAPLDRLRDEIERRSTRDLKPLPLNNVPEEVQPLISALNRQFAMLDQFMAGRDRFLADATHQLKTPLAVLQTQLELAMLDEEPEVRRSRFEQMADGTRRANHLVHQLLALARAEPGGGLTAQRTTVNLGAIGEKIASSHLDAAIAKGIDLGFDLAPSQVVGVPWLLQELLANLTDNALAYTPAGGSVTVRTGIREGNAFLEVEDDGPGIAIDQRNKVFERFYRIPGSPGDGCGLGLAIAREIASLHGGSISIASGQGNKGTVVAVSFPNGAAVATRV